MPMAGDTSIAASAEGRGDESAEQLLGLGEGPEEEFAVGATGGKRAAVRTELKAVDRVGMAGECAHLVA